MTVDLGAPVTSTWSGAPTGGTIAVAITRPDGTAFSAPAPTVDGQGARVTYVPNMPGRWFIAWTSTGSKVSAYTDIVDVWPADPRFLISVDDARSAIGWAVGNVTAQWLDDLRLYIAAATPVIEDIVGTVVPKTFTQVIPKGWNFAALYERPVNAITSIVYPDATTITEYDLRSESGMLYLSANTTAAATVTYTAGVTQVPQNVRLATRELVRHWWQQGMQAQHAGGGEGEVTTQMGYAVPRRVMELASPDSKPGGFG